MVLSARLKIILFVGFVLVTAAAPRFYVSRPKVACWLPTRDYQYQVFAQPVVAVSMDIIDVLPPIETGVLTAREALRRSEGSLLRTSPEEVSPAIAGTRQDPRRIRLAQFVAGTLQIEHCSISKVAVQFSENGDWLISFQADQNPALPFGQLPQFGTSNEPTLFTEHLRRNQFVVQARCYAEEGRESEVRQLGKPLIAVLSPPPFWVQKAEPLQFAYQGNALGIARFFESIDRVELEFAFRRDAP